jgi:hypothetical protein
MAFQEAYTVACIELFSCLWVELERLSVAEDTSCLEFRSAISGTRAEVLRLELVLLLDSCRSERRRQPLDISERLALQNTLEQVLDAINASSGEEHCDSIARAQNFLLDAVLDHCAAYGMSTVARPARRQYISGTSIASGTACRE